MHALAICCMALHASVQLDNTGLLAFTHCDTCKPSAFMLSVVDLASENSQTVLKDFDLTELQVAGYVADAEGWQRAGTRLQKGG